MTSSEQTPWVRVTSSPGLPGLLAELDVSLAFSTYQSGKLFLAGRTAEGGLAVNERTFNKAMGLFVEGESLWLATQFQLWRFSNVLRPGESYNGADRLYVPHTGHTTGSLDTHDVVIESAGRPVFVATLFNCLATLDGRFHFTPVWRPPFVSSLSAEDRCHLNGLALDNGRIRYATAVSRTDTADGWRQRRRDGGVVMEIPSGEPVCVGLSMPHSPRVHDGKLWVLNSGEGHLGFVEGASGRFEPVAFCPGYLRGLAFAGDYAVVGLSRPRRDENFGDLELQDALTRRGESAVCGLLVIDTRSGEAVEWLQLSGEVTELYDVAVLPGAARPAALGFKTDEIDYTVAVADVT